MKIFRLLRGVDLTAVPLAVIGAANLMVAALAVEGSECFYFRLGHRIYVLPGDSLLGDFGTYVAMWQLLGLSCLGTATCIAFLGRVKDRGVRLLLYVCVAVSFFIGFLGTSLLVASAGL